MQLSVQRERVEICSDPFQLTSQLSNGVFFLLLSVPVDWGNTLLSPPNVLRNQATFLSGLRDKYHSI
jgi:hypothetical protein